MAVTNGRVVTSRLKNSYFYVDWQKSSDSTAKNYTIIKWQAGLNCGTSGSGWDSWYSNAIKINKITANGQTLELDSTGVTNKTYSNISGAGDHQLASGTAQIDHNSDGKKTFTITISGWLYNYGNTSGSDSFELPKIPRTSNVSLSSTNFNIGTSITINTNRASSDFTHTAVIEFNGSTVKTQKSIGASYEWDTSELYNYIPKSNKATGTVTLTTYSGSEKIGSSSIEFTANVTDSNPIFSNCIYEDTGEMSTQLTGNSQVVINDYNVLEVTIPVADKAIAKNGATMDTYRLVCGSQSTEVSYSSKEDVKLKLYYITSKTFTLYAIDSRKNSTCITKTIEEVNWKNYFYPVIKTGLAERTGGVGTETILTFEGTFWNNNFGEVNNTIRECKYRYKKTLENESNFSDYIEISPTVSGNNFNYNLSIQGDLEANGFDSAFSYDIEISVKDEIGFIDDRRTTIYKVLLGSGTPGMALHRKGVSYGGPYNEEEGGLLQINGRNILKQKVLWEDASYMQGNQQAVLSHKVSEQTHGIILVFSGYSNGEGRNWNWTSQFISKKEVELTEGAGHLFLSGGTQGVASFKYIYIYDDRLEGNDANTLQNGNYDNKACVLRYVIGV